MRILHTSDWHLGRSFGPSSLRGPQEAFCDRLVEVTKQDDIDLVVVAGDIFDRAIAPVEAIELFRDTLARLRSTGAVVAAITGNHDGADRVAPYGDLTDQAGVFIRGGYDGLRPPVTLDFADGPLQLVLVPFLEPQAAPSWFGGMVDHREPSAAKVNAENESTQSQGTAKDPTETESTRRRRRTHHEVLEIAVAQARSQLGSQRSVAVAHAFVTGGSVTDSERQLEVGGTGEVSAELFDGFSYTALGHLHRPQDVGGPTLRYCGTPMAYSFSENHQKSLTLVDMDAAGACRVEEIPLGVGRPVSILTGRIDELLDPDHAPEAHDHFVRADLTDPGTVLDAKARLERVYPHIIEIRLSGTTPEQTLDPVLDGRSSDPGTATLQFWSSVEGVEADEDTVHALHRAVATALAAGS